MAQQLPLATDVLPILATLESTDGGLRLGIFAAILFCSIALAAQRSSYLIDIYIVVSLFNRFVRRVLDWSDGSFDTLPILSMVGPLIGVLLFTVSVSRMQAMPPRPRRAFQLVLMALIYSLCIGAGNGVGALHGLLEYLTPFGMLFYGISLPATQTTITRWIRLTVVCASVVATYGVLQWIFVPPWDASWLVWSGMRTMGDPVPFRMSVFSTLESRGPFAWFMAFAIAPMVADRRWRPAGSLPLVIVAMFALLLSRARSGWGMAIIAPLVYSATRGTQSLWKTCAVLTVSVTVLLFAVGSTPQAELIAERLETLQDIQNDGSLAVRTGIAQRGVWRVLTTPQGYGLGSSGIASARLATGRSMMTDNGYLELLATFGLPGSACIAAALWILVADTWKIHKHKRDPAAALALGCLTAGLCALLIANWLRGAYSGYTLMLIGGVIGCWQCTRAPLQICRPSLPAHYPTTR